MCAFCNIIICGLTYSYGILFPSLLDEFKQGKAKTGILKMPWFYLTHTRRDKSLRLIPSGTSLFVWSLRLDPKRLFNSSRSWDLWQGLVSGTCPLVGTELNRPCCLLSETVAEKISVSQSLNQSNLNGEPETAQ